MRGSLVLFLSDNQAIVTCLVKVNRTRSVRGPITELPNFCMLTLALNTGRGTYLADKKHCSRCPLSQQITRNPLFHPQALRILTEASRCQLELLSDKTLRWTSSPRKLLFTSILQEVLLEAQ